jgi:dihydrofolate reductase
MQRPETIVYIACTVDGFIARPDDGIDWLDHDPGSDDYGWAAFREGIDAMVMGRRTMDQVLKMGVEWPYQGLTTAVWSRTLTTAQLPEALQAAGVFAMPGTPAELLAALGERGAKKIWIDGGQTLQTFLAAGLVDTLTVTRIPVLIGAGRSLFGAVPEDVALVHQETIAFGSGVVQSTYRLG